MSKEKNERELLQGGIFVFCIFSNKVYFFIKNTNINVLAGADLKINTVKVEGQPQPKHSQIEQNLYLKLWDKPLESTLFSLLEQYIMNHHVDFNKTTRK